MGGGNSKSKGKAASVAGGEGPGQRRKGPKLRAADLPRSDREGIGGCEQRGQEPAQVLNGTPWLPNGEECGGRGVQAKWGGALRQGSGHGGLILGRSRGEHEKQFIVMWFGFPVARMWSVRESMKAQA